MIKTKDYHTFSMIRIEQNCIFSMTKLFEKVMTPEFCHLLKNEKTHPITVRLFGLYNAFAIIYDVFVLYNNVEMRCQMPV